jgi:hypothetical protein
MRRFRHEAAQASLEQRDQIGACLFDAAGGEGRFRRIFGHQDTRLRDPLPMHLGDERHAGAEEGRWGRISRQVVFAAPARWLLVGVF